MRSTGQVDRIVGLVAELNRRSENGGKAVSLAELASAFQVTEAQISADIRVLTLLCDHPESDWLLSLQVAQVGNRVSVSSRGPFRRPMRFTPLELTAIQAGLSGVTGSAGLKEILASVLKEGRTRVERERITLTVVPLARKAITDRRKIEIRYTGERTLQGVNRVIHPYGVLEQEGNSYIVAWCEVAGGYRHFRADRVVDCLPLEEFYIPRGDYAPPASSFVPADGAVPVQVRFGSSIARWIRELHPECETRPDGSVVVTYLVASPEWLVRQVLHYGPEAEVIEPASFRELMRREVAR